MHPKLPATAAAPPLSPVAQGLSPTRPLALHLSFVCWLFLCPVLPSGELCCVAFFVVASTFLGVNKILKINPARESGREEGWKYYYALHMCLAWHVSALPAFLNTSCQVTLLQAFFLLLFLFPSPALFSFY